MSIRACLVSVVVVMSMASSMGCAAQTDGGEDVDDPTVEGEESSAGALTASDYPASTLSPQEKAQLLATYNIDPHGVVPKALLTEAVAFFDHNKAKVKNKNFLTEVDFSKHSGKQRFFLVNLTSGAFTPYVVAHGSGSDPGNSGYATKFSNITNSN